MGFLVFLGTSNTMLFSVIPIAILIYKILLIFKLILKSIIKCQETNKEDFTTTIILFSLLLANFPSFFFLLFLLLLLFLFFLFSFLFLVLFVAFCCLFFLVRLLQQTTNQFNS